MTIWSRLFDTQSLAEDDLFTLASITVETAGISRNDGNLLEPYGDSSGMQVKVRTGGAIWGPLLAMRSDAEEVLTITSNSSGLPRIDRVVARADRSANEAVLDVLVGTPGASPTAPALTWSSTVREIPIAQVRVASGATTISVSNVTDERRFARYAGSLPLGTPLLYPTDLPRPWWVVEAQGQTISAITYADLIAALGLSVSAGVATLPNWNDNRMVNATSTSLPGVGGSQTHTLAVGNIPPLEGDTSLEGDHDHYGPNSLQYIAGETAESALWINRSVSVVSDHVGNAGMDVTYLPTTGRVRHQYATPLDTPGGDPVMTDHDGALHFHSVLVNDGVDPDPINHMPPFRNCKWVLVAR